MTDQKVQSDEDDDLAEKDCVALTLAFVQARSQSPARAAQLDDMLTDGVQAKPDLGLPRSPCPLMTMLRPRITLSPLLSQLGERHARSAYDLCTDVVYHCGPRAPPHLGPGTYLYHYV